MYLGFSVDNPFHIQDGQLDTLVLLFFSVIFLNHCFAENYSHRMHYRSFNSMSFTTRNCDLKHHDGIHLKTSGCRNGVQETGLTNLKPTTRMPRPLIPILNNSCFQFVLYIIFVGLGNVCAVTVYLFPYLSGCMCNHCSRVFYIHTTQRIQ